MNDSVQFLKLMRRGYDPQELFEKAYSEKEKEVYQNVNNTALSIISKQKEMQKDVTSVVNSIAFAEVLKPSEEMLEALKVRNQQLRDIIERTKNAIEQTMPQVEDRRQNIAALKQELENLRENYIKLQQSNQNSNLSDLCEILCKNTSLITKSRSDNGQEINIPPLPNTDTSISLFTGSQIAYTIAR